MKVDKKISLDKVLSLLMERKKINGAKLANELGINKATLHNWCNGVVPRSLETIHKIAEYFDVSVEYLVFGEKEVVDHAGPIDPEFVEDGEEFIITVRRRKKNSLKSSGF